MRRVFRTIEPWNCLGGTKDRVLGTWLASTPTLPDYRGVSRVETQGVFHLPKNSGNSGRVVNGTRLLGSFHWKFSGINGIPEKVVPFSRWKFLNGKFVFHLQIYCLITSSMPFAVY